MEQFPVLGGKSRGKSGSTNKPKEPTPLTKTREVPSKPKEAVVITKTKQQSPPVKASESTPPVIVKEAAIPKAKSEAVPEVKTEGQPDLRLESLPNPTVRDRSRIRSIATVLDDVEKEIQEIDAQKQAQSLKGSAKAQEVKAPQVIPDVSSQVSRVSTTPIQVQPVVPPTTQPLTLDNLMAGTMQPV